jgi:glycosyltransferase involved in cell wall biosynthesis
MTRVALLPSAYLPDLGGVEELTHNLATTLAGRGHAVEVWTAKVPAIGPTTEDELDGIAVLRVPFALPALRPRSMVELPRPGFEAVRSLHRAVRRFRPDVLHVQCFGPNGVYATGLSYLTGIPLVVTLQGETVNNAHAVFDRSAILRSGLRLSIRRAAAVTGCSQFTLDDASARFGLPVDRGQVVFNGVDPDEGFGAEPRTGDGSTNAAAPTVLAMGRLVANKGFDLLIEAFSRIATDHPAATLVIGGDGEARSSLEAQVGQLDLVDRVVFTGRLDRQGVARSLRDAAVFVMPSLVEPFGIVVLEAWRAGTPVIATSRGGPPEFVEDGRTGLLVDPTDVPAMAAALDRLLRDPGLRRRIGEAGRGEMARFTWSAITDRYLQIYDQVVGRPPRGRP